MQISNYFDMKRLYLLIKKDFYTQYKTYLIALGAIFSILFIFVTASIAGNKTWNFHALFYPLTLFIGGFIFTSQSFRELDNENSLVFYLSLPASNFEKFISKLIISSIGYIIVSVILYFLFSSAAYIIGTLIFGYSHQIFNPADPAILTSIRLYFITQSVFLLGAIYFKGNNFIKTVLSIFVFVILYLVFIGLIIYILSVFISLKGHIYFPYEILNYFLSEENSNEFIFKGITGIRIIVTIIKILFWYFLAPLMWVITFFRLKESGI